MITWRDAGMVFVGIVLVIVLFFLCFGIASAVQKQPIGQTIADFFNPEVVLENPDDTTNDDTTGTDDEDQTGTDNAGTESGDDEDPEATA